MEAYGTNLPWRSDSDEREASEYLIDDVSIECDRAIRVFRSSIEGFREHPDLR